MQVKAVSWVGVKTEQFEAMRSLLAEVLGLRGAIVEDDFAVYSTENGDKVEIFGPSAGEPAAQFARNEVTVGFLVEDLEAASAELAGAGVELVGKRGGDSDYAWQHFRAPDGKVFELAEDSSRR